MQRQPDWLQLFLNHFGIMGCHMTKVEFPVKLYTHQPGDREAIEQ
jgi:hypothetical protein